MKEGISSVSLFQIVVLFLLLFTGIMCLTINHSKAFGIKDEIINILETSIVEPSSGSSYQINFRMNEIVELFKNSGYRNTGKCPVGWNGFDREGNKDSDNASFCIRIVDVSDAYHKDIDDKCDGGKCDVTSDDFPTMVYYDVALFYQLDIPFIKNVFNLKTYGSTKVLFG